MVVSFPLTSIVSHRTCEALSVGLLNLTGLSGTHQSASLSGGTSLTQVYIRAPISRDWSASHVQRHIEPALVREARSGRAPRFLTRALRRLRATARWSLSRLQKNQSAFRFAGLLALVSILMLSPLLLDDLAFRTSYLLRNSPDAVTISKPKLIDRKSVG